MGCFFGVGDLRRHAYRYCGLSIEPPLFEDVGLLLEWGRVGQRGRRIVELCPAAAATKVPPECAWQVKVGSSQLFRGRTRPA